MKVTVPEPGVNAPPLFVQSPLTFIFPDGAVKVPPAGVTFLKLDVLDGANVPLVN